MKNHIEQWDTFVDQMIQRDREQVLSMGIKVEDNNRSQIMDRIITVLGQVIATLEWNPTATDEAVILNDLYESLVDKCEQGYDLLPIRD